ncbi:hypothetical protein PC110_g21423 [Phytophthora cactorum]|uniref:Uncharacterized protein n=1 Tax=Phytophthora cactorum TaxID=29920 RepID=A0A329RFT5_9STRA|nr:hypothetical protein PC110_g21423 [Phytophthora cactorum]
MPGLNAKLDGVHQDLKMSVGGIRSSLEAIESEANKWRSG